MAFADESASSAVGDLPGYGEEAYFGEEAAYAETNSIAPAGHAGSATHYAPGQTAQYAPQPQYAPVGASQLQPTSFHGGPSCDVSCGCEYGCDGGCDSGCSIGGCDGGCDSGCGSKKRRKICGIFDKIDCDTWATTEFLMWFVQDRDMIPLVSMSPNGTLPLLDQNTTSVVFGDTLHGELSGGLRLDYGKWVSDNVGFGGRFWGLAENNDSFYAEGTPNGPSIGRPLLDLTFGSPNQPAGGENGILVNGPDLAGRNFVGSVAVESSIDIWAAEAYSRIRFSCAKNCRLDFIGGYSHFEIDDKLAISSSSTLVNPATLQTFNFRDLFDIENEFNGGQLGFEMVITRGCWRASSLTKVHLGNMKQTYDIQGVNFITTNPPTGVVINSGGLLARGNNQNPIASTDTFSFIPEANFKLAYRFRRNVLLSAGYSFLYFDNVALTGDVVDRVTTSTANLPTGNNGSRPAFPKPPKYSSLFVQGLDLGVVIDF
jgi:hypothetical protein